MAVKSCKGLKRCENTKHQASLVKTPLEDICSRSGSLEANSEMRGRGFELCIRDQYPQQEKRGRLAQRLKCRAHRIPPGRSSGASATHPPCPELGSDLCFLLAPSWYVACPTGGSFSFPEGRSGGAHPDLAQGHSGKKNLLHHLLGMYVGTLWGGTVGAESWLEVRSARASWAP